MGCRGRRVAGPGTDRLRQCTDFRQFHKFQQFEQFQPDGAGFTDNSLGDQVRGYRKPDADTGFDGVSSKSQQVEKDLGVQ